MHDLFEKVAFPDNSIIWEYKVESTQNFPGFYHWHQCCEIIIVHEGTGSIVMNQQTYEICHGRIFFFQPFQLHRVHAQVSSSHPYIRSKIHFNPYDFEEKLRVFPILHRYYLHLWNGNHPQQTFDMGDLFEYVEQILFMYTQRTSSMKSSQKAEYEHSLVLILQLLNALSPMIENLKLCDTIEIQPRLFTHAEKIMLWIEEHYMEDIQLEDIAEAMHLSKFYLSRLFQREIGTTISQYLTNRRMKIACQLLQTTHHSIEHIGSSVGIPNPSYFIRTFKKIVGVTPLRYRQNN